MKELTKVYVNRDRFVEACKAKGMTMQQASKKIRMGTNYFSGRMHDGFIPEYVALLVENVLGIPRSEYEFVEEQMTIEKPQTDNELKQTIYEAVMMALRDTMVQNRLKGGKK